MFTSSSHSCSNTFGYPPVFGQGNQKGDAFAPNTLSGGIISGSSTATGLSDYGGTSNWAFCQTSSPLSSTTTFGAPLYGGFGSSTSALGSSSSGNFGSPLGFTQWNQKGGSFASKPLDQGNVFGFPTGMSYSQGTSTWTFNQTSSPLSTPTTFGTPSSYSFGTSTTGGSTFETGSRMENYKRTPETAYSADKLVSISGMPVYKDKRHEELRWEDYKSTAKGGFGASSSAVKSTSSGLSPFSSSPVANFSTNSWGTTSVSTPKSTPNPFEKTIHFRSWKHPGPTSTSQPLPFSSSTNTSSPLNSFNPFLPKTNPFTSLSNDQIPSSNSSSPTFAPFITPHSLSGFWPNPNPTPLNENPFSNLFTSQPTQTSSSSFSSPTFTPLITPPSLSKNHNGPLMTSSLAGLWPSPIPTSSASMVTTPANPVTSSPMNSGFGPTFNQPTTLSTPLTENHNGEITGTVGQPFSAPSPFGTLPPKSHLSFEGSTSTQPIQYGISSIPVKDRPALVKYPLTTRHFSRRSKLPIRKYEPKLNGLKVPYFSDSKEIPVDVLVPRENPRALVITSNMHEINNLDNIYENEKDDKNDYDSSDDSTEKKKLFATVLDVPPKLKLPDYYTKPTISELEAKERAEPGFCSHVKDFVIGRHGYGSIRFLGETDVRNLDLESYVQFNKREVIVYLDDDTSKHPVGQGLNKPAEITLLNIKCIDKRSGVVYKDGPKIDKYREMLKKKVAAQGGEFVSYDPVEGEWKFRVQHF